MFIKQNWKQIDDCNWFKIKKLLLCLYKEIIYIINTYLKYSLSVKYRRISYNMIISKIVFIICCSINSGLHFCCWMLQIIPAFVFGIPHTYFESLKGSLFLHLGYSSSVNKLWGLFWFLFVVVVGCQNLSSQFAKILYCLSLDWWLGSNTHSRRKCNNVPSPCLLVARAWALNLHCKNQMLSSKIRSLWKFHRLLPRIIRDYLCSGTGVEMKSSIQHLGYQLCLLATESWNIA